MKTCSQCNECKTTSEFGTNRYQCNKCRSAYVRKWRSQNPERTKEIAKKNFDVHGRKYMLKHRFGMTLDEYQSKLAVQAGACAICLSTDPKRSLAVDHSHRTGKVRDLLCTSCNMALGSFKEDIARLESAIAYLRKHGS